MKINGFTLDDDGHPDFISVSMSADEALFLAVFIGATKDPDRERVMPGAGRIGSDIYDCLADRLFNRWWDDGVKDALRERPPPSDGSGDKTT